MRDSREPLQILQGRVRGLAVAGITAAAIGMIIGVAMAVHATHIQCPDGTISTGNSIPPCYAHYHAGEGTAIAVICGVLVVLVVLAVLVFDAVVDVRTQLPALRKAISKLDNESGHKSV